MISIQIMKNVYKYVGIKFGRLEFLSENVSLCMNINKKKPTELFRTINCSNMGQFNNVILLI